MPKVDGNLEGKMTCGFINDTRNLVNFTRALKNLKVEADTEGWCMTLKVDAWHWRLMKYRKAN